MRQSSVLDRWGQLASRACSSAGSASCATPVPMHPSRCAMPSWASSVARRLRARRVRHGEKDTQDHAANAHLPCDQPADGSTTEFSTNSLSVGRRESRAVSYCGHRARHCPPGTRALDRRSARPLWLHWRSMPFWDGSRTGQPPCGGAMPQISGSRRPSARPRPPRSATRGERRASSRCA